MDFKLLSEKDAIIQEAGSEAISDYNRAVILYEHRVLSKKEFIQVTRTISQVLITAIEGIKVGDNND